ncbi:hypothetical protein ACEE49_11170 [[Pasteurella] aerogenes]
MEKLYDRSFEREHCGFGFIANLDGVQSHKVVRSGVFGLSRMQHRGANLTKGEKGDGGGLSLKMPGGVFRSMGAGSGV